MCWTSLYTNNVNKTIGGKDEPNIIFVFFCREQEKRFYKNTYTNTYHT